MQPSPALLRPILNPNLRLRTFLQAEMDCPPAERGQPMEGGSEPSRPGVARCVCFLMGKAASLDRIRYIDLPGT